MKFAKRVQGESRKGVGVKLKRSSFTKTGRSSTASETASLNCGCPGTRRVGVDGHVELNQKSRKPIRGRGVEKDRGRGRGVEGGVCHGGKPV